MTDLVKDLREIDWKKPRLSQNLSAVVSSYASPTWHKSFPMIGKYEGADKNYMRGAMKSYAQEVERTTSLIRDYDAASTFEEEQSAREALSHHGVHTVDATKTMFELLATDETRQSTHRDLSNAMIIGDTSRTIHAYSREAIRHGCNPERLRLDDDRYVDLVDITVGLSRSILNDYWDSTYEGKTTTRLEPVEENVRDKIGALIRREAEDVDSTVELARQRCKENYDDIMAASLQRYQSSTMVNDND